MRIHRSHPDDHFTIIPNATLRDQRLTYNARGVLMELLSHTDGWETNADALSDLARRHRGEISGEGRRALRSAFSELEELGYLVRRTERRERGRFVTVLELYDTPGHRDTGTGTSVVHDDPWAAADRGTADGASVDGTFVDATSVTGTSTRSTNQRTTNKEEPTNEESTALADARAAADAARDDQLQRLYAVVDRFNHETLRDCLLKFERHRPAIYRQCRQRALAQLERADTRILNRDQAAREVDNLSFKYGVLHYEPKRNWPGWMVKALEAQHQSDQKGKAS